MRKIIPFLFVLTVLIAACSSIDCPLNNKVQTKYMLKGKVTTLKDTLTISTARPAVGSDSVLLNRYINKDSFMLPVSYQAPEDVFYFQLTDLNGNTTLDTVRVKKNDMPHFESVDCNPSFFHTLTGVQTTHHAIDSIVIQNSYVTYDSTKANFYIYFKDTSNAPDYQ